MSTRVGSFREVVNGEAILVSHIRHRRCGPCGEAIVDGPAERALRDDAFTVYRRRHGLLLAEEIRAIRTQLGFSQGERAILLRLGPNTLSRREVGRNVQTGAMDLLLRVLTDVRGALDYLRQKAA